MEVLKWALVLVFLTLSTTSAFNTLVPEGKEVIYDFQGLVKAGTHHPTSFASQFILQAKIHLQSNQNATFVRLSDLSYKIYNGVMDHVHEHQPQSVPLVGTVLDDLKKVFKVVYDSHGKAVGISTAADEKEYTRNIKKAIATVLQLDVEQSIVKHKSSYPMAFTTKEHTLHGFSTINYNVLPRRSPEVVTVHKLFYVRHSKRLFPVEISNMELLSCDLTQGQPIAYDSQKKYVIAKQDDGHMVVRTIEANSGVFYFPFEAKSDPQFVAVNQTFHLVQVQPIKQQLQLESERFEHGLLYHLFDLDVTTDVMVDVTNGRGHVDSARLVPKVRAMLDRYWEYIKIDLLNAKHMDVDQIKLGHVVNQVQRLLTHFDLHKLEEMRANLANKAELVEIFDNILPFVGTKSSMLFIKNLVMNKKVDEETAIHMLQHMPQHVMMPTKALLSEMEPLIHLGEPISWRVRKVAILSFASLVHKSFEFTVKHQLLKLNRKPHADPEQHLDVHEIQQYFEKYVTDYINKARSAGDNYRVQNVYLQGLFNMKMDSLGHHMKPAVTGEWWPSHPQSPNQHLRLMSLWTVAPIALKDTKVADEVLWPVFINRDEETELRITAYYFIMLSEPSLSKLGDIYWYMMREPNEELYRFHYTYVQSLMKTVEPCKQEFRLRLAHVMKYMHSPSHGISTAEVADFKDPTYGFSGAFDQYYVHTNESDIFTVVVKSQLFHEHSEDYLLYVKIHGAQEISNYINGFTTKFNVKSMMEQDFSHVDVIVMKQQSIVDSYAIALNDMNDMGDLKAFFGLFNKDQHKVTLKKLHVNYNDNRKKSLIPTDLGFPLVWEIMVPMTEQGNLVIDKKMTNDIINLHVEGRYANWVGAQHGLSFYNPILNVWQGVSRMHQHHVVLPLRWDVSINRQQFLAMKMSWTKTNNDLLDVGGMRSHVSTVVFVNDDDDIDTKPTGSRGELGPLWKDMVLVSNGKEYDHDYTLIDNDDLNTGHRWQVKIFDSDHHVSNGSFNHLVQTFVDTHEKNVQSPLSHLLTSLYHSYAYTRYMARPGTYGLLVRTEPSKAHGVTDIDIALRMNWEKDSEDADDEIHLAPRSKRSARITYAVKNKEQSLKTWDVTGSLEMNDGHTVNNLKMFMTRIIPGQKDYKVCVTAVKKWTADNGITGHLNVATSQAAGDSKCVKDDTVVDVTMIGEPSSEQKQHRQHVYGSCQYVIPYSVEPYYTLECLVDHTTVRHYVYNVKTTNVPVEFRNIIGRTWDLLKGHYISYYTHEDEHLEQIGENNLKVDVTYPMDGDQVDIQVFTPNNHHQLTGVPTERWEWLGVVPDSTVYPEDFIEEHAMGGFDHCTVHHDHMQMNHHRVLYEMVKEEWTKYVVMGATRTVMIKHVPGHKIAVKVVHTSPSSVSFNCKRLQDEQKSGEKQHTLEIIPTDGEDHFKITLDDQVLPNTDHHNDHWVSVKVITREVVPHQPAVIVMLHQIGIHMEYYGTRVNMMVPKADQRHTWTGHCYEH